MKTTPELIDPFIKSTKETFATMAGLDVQMEKLRIRDKNAQNNVAISGIIGLSGDIQGVMILEFPIETALAVVSKFIGETITVIDEDVHDAVGELANIISGNAKKNLRGFNVSIGLPTVVEGSDYTLHLSKDANSQQAFMTSDAGEFIMEICMKYQEE